MDEPGQGTGPVLILGVERSGTSLVADMIFRWGAYGGDPEPLRAGNAGNPRGYFEHPEMTEFVSRLLKKVEVGYWQPSFAERVRQQADEPELRAAAAALVAQMAENGGIWFWKNPFLSMTLPFWQEIIRDATYVIPFRNPCETAVSWAELTTPPPLRGRISLVFANLLRWQLITLAMLERTAGKRRLFVAYEDLLRSPRQESRRLAAFLDGVYGPPGSREDRTEIMAQTVDPALHRQRSDIPFAAAEQATPEQKALYQLLLRLVDEPDTPFDPGPYSLAFSGWREYLDNLALFRGFYSQAAPLVESPTVRFVAGAARGGRRLLRVPKKWWRRLASAPSRRADASSARAPG
jgi:hypothetical protein